MSWERRAERGAMIGLRITVAFYRLVGARLSLLLVVPVVTYFFLTDRMGRRAIADYLALVGDTADGIPGLPRWGAKSSGTVLTAYGSLEAIPEDPESWSVKVRGAARLGETLAAHRDAALLYRTLATLRTDVPLEEDLDDLLWQGARHDELRDVCEALGDEGLSDLVQRLEEDRGVD